MNVGDLVRRIRLWRPTASLPAHPPGPRESEESGVGIASGRGHRSRRTIAAFLAVGALVAGSVVTPAAPSRAADTSVTVDFATAGGAPTYRASGMIYGMTPNGSLPQDHFFKDIKWHFMRAGGAQLNSGGYATSLAEYRPAGTRPWPSTGAPPPSAGPSCSCRTTCGAPTAPPTWAGPVTTETGRSSTTSSPSS